MFFKHLGASLPLRQKSPLYPGRQKKMEKYFRRVLKFKKARHIFAARFG
jgi:hypothetical protein